MKKLLVLFLALIMCVTALVACGGTEDPVEYKLDKAVLYVKNLYNAEQIKEEGSEVGCATKYADFKRVSSVTIAGVAYAVEWSVDVTDASKVKVVQGSGTTETVIDVNEKTDADINFVLTATVKAGDGTSEKLTFNFLVPKYDVITYEQFREKKSGDSATIEGIVVALNSKSEGNKRNHIFAVDAQGKGGYYAYDMADDPVKLGIEPGMTVAISGTVDIYNGMYELKDATARVINAEKANITPIDVTSKFGAGQDILQYVGSLITIKGVEIGGQELDVANSQYLFFSLNGNESYIRTYVTDLPTSFEVTTDEEGNTVCADKAVMDEAHAAKRDWTANVTGVLIAYNGTPYLMPIDTNCFEYLVHVEKTAEEKVNDTIDEIKVPAVVYKDGDVALALKGDSYDEVVISWVSDNAAAVIGEGKVTFTVPNDAIKVKLTATFTYGEVTKTKDYTVTLTKVMDPNTYVSIPEANAMGEAQDHNKYTEGKYFVTGVIDSIASDKYGNMTIKDADGNTLYLYGLYSVDGEVRYDAMATKPVVGDTITVYGSLGRYNDSVQMKNAWLVSVPAADSELNLVSANVIGLAQGHNKYTAGKYIVTGIIESIASTKYGNMTIKDANGNTLYLYGLYSADGATRYDAMEVKPQVGDTITVIGIVGQYNGTAQVKNGWMTAHTVAPEEGGGAVEGTTVTKSVADLITANSWNDTTVGQEFTLDSVVTVKIAGGDNTGKAYGGDHIRIYATDSPAGSITITVAEGYELVSVKITTKTGTYAFLNVEGVEGDVSNKSVEVSGSSVVLTSVKNGTDGKQVRVTEIEVVYAAKAEA